MLGFETAQLLLVLAIGVEVVAIIIVVVAVGPHPPRPRRFGRGLARRLHVHGRRGVRHVLQCRAHGQDGLAPVGGEVAPLAQVHQQVNFALVLPDHVAGH